MTLADQIANLGYPVGMGMAPHPKAVAAMRAAIIEECAQVADEWQRSVSAKPVGDAIRALKDKP